MFKDNIVYENKKFQLSAIKLDGYYEIMIFPIEFGVVSGREVYCFRTANTREATSKYRDIYYNYQNYVSEEAINNYVREEE